MDALLPQTYLIGLVVILAVAAVAVGRQVWRVRRDELSLARLEQQGGAQTSSPADLYELGSAQLRKRLYGQASDTLRQALKRAQAEGEPPEAVALIENALGFTLAAQTNYKAAIPHYRKALQAKADYPVALNNLAFALEKQLKVDEAREADEQVLNLDPDNRTARRRLNLLGGRSKAA